MESFWQDEPWRTLRVGDDIQVGTSVFTIKSLNVMGVFVGNEEGFNTWYEWSVLNGLAAIPIRKRNHTYRFEEPSSKAD